MSQHSDLSNPPCDPKPLEKVISCNPVNKKRPYDYFYVIGVIENRSNNGSNNRSKNDVERFPVVPVVNSPVKIGFSKNPWARITDLKKSVHPDIELLACVGVAPNCRAKVAPYFQKAGNKPNWYFMDDNVKSLIRNINNESFTGLGNWSNPPIYGKWYRKTKLQPAPTGNDQTYEKDHKTDNENHSQEITTNQNHPNNINNNKQIEDENKPEDEKEALFAMTLEWQPSIAFTWLLDRNGQDKLEPSKLNEFILYWRTRPTVKRTQERWEHTLQIDLRKLEAKRKKAERREAAYIAAQLAAKIPGYTGQKNYQYGQSGGEKWHSGGYYGQSVSTSWPQAFKAFEKTETVVITEDGIRQNKAAHATHMAAAMASLGKRKWQNE